MKLNSKNYAALTALLALSCTQVYAGTMGPATPVASERIYLGVFGGGGASNQVGFSQYGTAFYSEASGGPLAVNAIGKSNTRNVGLVGAHLGYQWENILLTSFNNQASLSPSVELEGYYVGKSNFTAQEIDNDTTRLLEHDFLITYPTSTGVMLANTVLNFNWANYAKWHPYVGAGIGAAVLSISNANSLQTSPLEADVNHFNGNPNDSTAVFAAQTKVGLNYAFNEHVSLFAEYRWLYISAADFTFGSTSYPSHVATSSWNGNLGAQNYNLGVGGIRFTI